MSNYSKLCYKIDKKSNLGINMGNVNYNEILNKWRNNVIKKSKEAKIISNNYQICSKEYYKYRSYAEGLDHALMMLLLEENEVKNNIIRNE